jgi:glycosyltransferase involved in cell wall biosynthesis
MEKTVSKTKVLAWGDYACGTGFGTVMKNIMGQLHKTGQYEIDVVGVNYDGGPYDTKLWPGRLWPAISALRTQGPYGDVFGRQVFLDLLSRNDYDVVFIVQDTFITIDIVPQILELQRTKPNTFSTIYYYPFDCAPREEWVSQCVASFDFPVAYTEYAKNESRKVIGELANKQNVIYHGTNTKDFFPLSDNDKKNFRNLVFPTLADKFIITNVNRNQGRKDISRSFMILKELRNRGVDNAFLYMHMQERDFGGSLLEMSRSIGVKPNEDFTIPNPQEFGAHSGFPIDFLNGIYNASDCYLTTTHGEGWGLSITEAMATKLPVVAPGVTSVPEILGEDRGWQVRSGHTSSHWIIKENDNERMRPLMDVEEAADKIVYIMNHPEEAAERAENGYKWILEHTWSKLAPQWLDVFKRATSKTVTSRRLNQGMTGNFSSMNSGKEAVQWK